MRRKNSGQVLENTKVCRISLHKCKKKIKFKYSEEYLHFLKDLHYFLFSSESRFLSHECCLKGAPKMYTALAGLESSADTFKNSIAFFIQQRQCVISILVASTNDTSTDD